MTERLLEALLSRTGALIVVYGLALLGTWQVGDGLQAIGASPRAGAVGSVIAFGLWLMSAVELNSHLKEKE